jgi:hypothetical protein
MDTGFAVFNQHVNDAGKRAEAAFITAFGVKTWNRVMKPLVNEGIMAMFQKPPTVYTLWYARTVQAIVNDGELPKGDTFLLNAHTSGGEPPKDEARVKMERIIRVLAVWFTEADTIHGSTQAFSDGPEEETLKDALNEVMGLLKKERGE